MTQGPSPPSLGTQSVVRSSSWPGVAEARLVAAVAHRRVEFGAWCSHLRHLGTGVPHRGGSIKAALELLAHVESPTQ